MSKSLYQIHCAKTNQGGRPHQQDRMLVKEYEHRAIYAVFDGHGNNGGDVADFLSSKLSIYLDDNLETPDRHLISSCFHNLELELRQSKLDCYMSGSTCSILILNENGVATLGYVGDSSILICSKKKTEFGVHSASVNHNCDNDSERLRIQENGGRIEKSDPSILILFSGTFKNI
eukprot:NODE_324_length_9702_cov_1.027491.p6 type:complete len:175 gc:universal NODE_324_length_9702_cov_1.027491:1211-687(-)